MAEVNPDQTGAHVEFQTIPRLYINAVRASFSYYDFQLILGNSALDNLGEEANLIVEPRFVVQMAPQHYKVLASMLSDQLEKYEKQFGKIPGPPTKKKPNE
jgi:hypothetical protein